jgi:hypothetical protein
MSYRRYNPEEDITENYFFDDFLGASYNTTIWSVLGGAGSIVQPTPNLGGQLIVRANANNFYQLTHIPATATNLAFSTGRKFSVIWRAKSPVLTTSAYWYGMQTNLSTRIRWFYDSTINANWWGRAAAGVEFDTGIAADTNWHEFKIVANTNLAHFYLDGIPRGTLTTSIPAGDMSPYVYVNSYTGATRDAYVA